MNYTVTFGRVVVCDIDIEADSSEEALAIAFDMEMAGKLGITVTPSDPEIIVRHVVDYEEIWEAELA